MQTALGYMQLFCEAGVCASLFAGCCVGGALCNALNVLMWESLSIVSCLSRDKIMFQQMRRLQAKHASTISLTGSGGDPVGVLRSTPDPSLSDSVGVQVCADPPLFSAMLLYIACNP